MEAFGNERKQSQTNQNQTGNNQQPRHAQQLSIVKLA